MCPIPNEFETCCCEGLSVCVTCASCDRIQKSRRAGISSVDCNARGSSSVVIDFMATLPLLPIFEGKLIKCSDMLSRSPHQLDRVDAFKVGVSAILR